MTSSTEQTDPSIAERANAIINGATECIDRGEHDGMKRRTCHVFRESDVCMCGDVDLRRYRMPAR
jgi:hypothetical protein